MSKEYSAIDMADTLSSCMQDPQSLLAKALENDDMRNFKIALDMEADPTRTDPVSNISLFERALQTYGKSDFVIECIRRGCKCDYTNRRTNKSPINYASDSKDPKIMSSILSLQNIPVDTKYANLTPMNSLAKNITMENYLDVKKCIQLLINYGASPNIPDQKEMTPILYITNSKKLDNDKKRELITYLLNSSEIDLDTFRDGEARERLQSRFPDIQLPSESTSTITYETLLTLIRNGSEDKFLKNFQEYQLNISERDNQQNISQENNLNLLMESIKQGQNNAFDAIVHSGININLTQHNSSPIEVAAVWGNHYALQVLLADNDLKLRKHENLLIKVIPKLNDDYINNRYYTCFYTLLDSDKIDVNEIDESGTSALHYAVKYKNPNAVKKLLKEGAYLGTKSVFNDFPISEINPEVLEEYFDSCIDTNSLKPGDDHYEIIINYSNLVPIQNKENLMKTVKNEMAPIEYISKKKELRHLLKHPLITSFLFLKWHRLSIIFYLNFILYSIFCASLVSFILLKFHNTTDETVIAVLQIFSILGLFYLILREIFQFFISPSDFLTSKINYLEIALIILTIVTLSEPDYSKEGQRVIAVFTILLASVELCLLVGSLPILSISTHWLMLRAVSTSFLKSFALYSIFVITFSLCFYILFGKPGKLFIENEKTIDTKPDANGKNTEDENVEDEFNNFVNPFTAIIKTIVMLTGEFDAGDINFQSFWTYLVFLLFVFFISIVMFNLLNGLAVSDTQAIKAQAELNGSIVRTNILSNYERALAGQHGRTAYLINHCQPFKSVFKYLTNLFPEYIPGSHIAILPNNNNRVLISAQKTGTELGTMFKSNGTSALLTVKNSKNYQDQEKRLLDYPAKTLPCLCSCLSGKCSEMDRRTVKTAIAILDKKKQLDKEKIKLQDTENRLKKIEETLMDIHLILTDLREKSK